ncbi:MAG TPA: hypothetical protein VIL72_07585 [Beijerinckiaceae bacterium]|jgi:hypothetical protein
MTDKDKQPDRLEDTRRDETPGENLGTQGDSDDVRDSPQAGMARPSPGQGDSDDPADEPAERTPS